MGLGPECLSSRARGVEVGCIRSLVSVWLWDPRDGEAALDARAWRRPRVPRSCVQTLTMEADRAGSPKFLLKNGC